MNLPPPQAGSHAARLSPTQWLAEPAELVIDPTLEYSTYLGGSASDGVIGITADVAGNAYVSGVASSTDFPVTSGVFQPKNNQAGQVITISDASSGATVSYTTDGSTPTTSSTKYTGPITLTKSETLKFIAVHSGDSNSPVRTVTDTIQ